jgi:glycosyltransferase involved in cell wall biosynthesis
VNFEKSKHFLIVTQYFWPETFRVNDLALGLVSRGHKVTVLTGIPNYPKGSFFDGYKLWQSAEEWNGVEIIRSPLLPRGRGKGWQLALNYLSFAIFGTITGIVKCRGNYDTILGFAPSPITSAFPAIALRSIKKIPFAFWLQDLWPESLTAAGMPLPSALMKLVRMMVDFIYKRCDSVFIQSPGFKQHVLSAGIPESKIHYVPNWAEELFQPVKANSEFAVKESLPQGFKVFFAGNIGKAQDFETILEAAKILRQNKKIHWVILGEGRQLKWVKKEIEKHQMKENFHLLGRKPMELMPSFFAHANVLLATLKKNPAFSVTIPSKIQSYLACKKPIIVSIEGVGAEIIRNSHSGICVAPGEPSKLADAVLEIFEMDKTAQEKLGENGLRYYQSEFERNMVIDRIIKKSSELQGKVL